MFSEKSVTSSMTANCFPFVFSPIFLSTWQDTQAGNDGNAMPAMSAVALYNSHLDVLAVNVHITAMKIASDPGQWEPHSLLPSVPVKPKFNEPKNFCYSFESEPIFGPYMHQDCDQFGYQKTELPSCLVEGVWGIAIRRNGSPGPMARSTTKKHLKQ